MNLPQKNIELLPLLAGLFSGTVQSISAVGTTYTVTTTANHRLTKTSNFADIVTLYNGTNYAKKFTITGTPAANQFTFTSSDTITITEAKYFKLFSYKRQWVNEQTWVKQYISDLPLMLLIDLDYIHTAEGKLLGFNFQLDLMAYVDDFANTGEEKISDESILRAQCFISHRMDVIKGNLMFWDIKGRFPFDDRVNNKPVKGETLNFSITTVHNLKLL